MAKRPNDTFDAPDEGNYTQSEPDDLAQRVTVVLESEAEAARLNAQCGPDSLARAATIALQSEAETERLREQVQMQHQQIQDLFRLMRNEKGPGPGKGGGKPNDSLEVQQFKKRTKVLKLAYPNTRI